MNFITALLNFVTLVVIQVQVQSKSTSVETPFELTAGLNIRDFIIGNGYPCEVHNITTEDGYILHTFRMPFGKHETTHTDRPAVILLHGILSSPYDWLDLGPEKSLGFLLADQGYDVWLMACRGNTYSVDHVSLEVDSYQFWNFSFHEIGHYDIPANIEYITTLTGNDKVSYVGHSQGGTSYAAMVGSRPEYNARISVSLLFSPVLYLEDVRVVLFDVLKANYDGIKELATKFQLLKGILPYNPVFHEITKVFCNGDSTLCASVLGSLCGFDYEQMENSAIQAMVTYDPAGSSFQSFLHFLQIAGSGKFRQFDWGDEGNMEKYNQTTPLEYDLSLITAPVVLFVAQNDFFVGSEDVKRFKKTLPKVITYEIPYTNMNHIDYFIAKDVLTLVNNPAISYLNSYNNK